MAMQGHGTSGTHWFKIARPNNEDKVPIAIQSRYRSGFVILLYLIKHSKHDLTNVFRELSKCMDVASITAYKEIIRVIRLVLDKKDTCLRLKLNLDDNNWDLVV
jgi:hypothetical protein